MESCTGGGFKIVSKKIKVSQILGKSFGKASHMVMSIFSNVLEKFKYETNKI